MSSSPLSLLNLTPNRRLTIRPPQPRVVVCFLALLTIASDFVIVRAADTGAVAIYRFDEKEGDVVRDAAASPANGRVVGDSAWAAKGISGTALLLNGRTSVRIPTTGKLELTGAHTIAAWVRGRASGTHFVSGFPDVRAPYYQVCGDTIYLATGSDAYVNDADKSYGSHLRGKDIYHLYSGTADISLRDWKYKRQTHEPLSGFEPKLQVVGNKVHYEYTGTADARKANQIWTAESALDGSAWRAWKRTDAARYDLLPPDDGRRDTMDVDHALYRTDHGQLSVAGGKIYIAYPAQDKDHVWQLWTGLYNQDGGNYESFQRTTDRGWIPSGIQTAGNRVYYLYSKGNNIFETYSHNLVQGTAKGPKTVEGFYVASTDLAGQDWKVIQRVGGPCPSGDSGAFHITNGRIHLIWVELEADGIHTRLFTGDMDLNGGDFRKMVRTPENGYAKTPIAGGVQIVGHRAYYVFSKITTADQRTESSLWTAEANLDGSNWVEQCVDPGLRPISVGYKGLVVVGAKRYLAPSRPPEGILGFGGANIVNKGDAYGLGVTETGLARGFVNAGQDFLFRGEAATDTSGAIADGLQPLTHNNWYHLAVVYDQARVALYINGALVANSPYKAPPRHNPFPLVIGDGFVGAIDEIQIYNRALSAEEMLQQYKKFR